MKIDFIYLSSDTKSKLIYKVIYKNKFKFIIQKYYFKIRLNCILIIKINLFTKKTVLSIYSEGYTYLI